MNARELPLKGWWDHMDPWDVGFYWKPVDRSPEKRARIVKRLRERGIPRDVARRSLPPLRGR